MCILALSAALFAYAPLDAPVVYRIKVGLEGALPMMAGDNKRAEVSMAFQVSGAEVEGKRATKFVLAEFSVGLLDSVTNTYQPLPLDKSAAKEYFPDTTVPSSARGVLGEVSPKAKRAPFRLPGVDTESLPALTFLALEFPETELATGRTWSYSRLLLGEKATYTATYMGKDEKGERFELKLSQKGAASKVEGLGSLWFDKPIGKILKGELAATVTSGTAAKPKTVKMKVSIEAKQELIK